jgi:alkylation response protein AidB-like acyl-CoA dehydrogenase
MQDSTPDADVLDMVRESARDFARRETDLKAFRQRVDAGDAFDPVRFAQMHDFGWRAALTGEREGGSGMGLAEAAAIVQALGSGLLGEAFTATAVLPVRLLVHAGTSQEATRLQQQVAQGSATLVLAWQEHEPFDGVQPVRTEARREGAAFRLSGAKRWIAGASAATQVLVTARLDGDTAVFSLPLPQPGLNLQWQPLADGSRAASAQLQDLELPPESLVDAGPHVARALERAIDEAAIVASAELLGVMSAAFEMTLAYLRQRVQFDRVIGSFQALQHKAVDLLVQRELSAAVLAEAVAAQSGAPDELARLASRCKARCSDAALRITRECIQLHGAIGYTHEHDIGLYLKRALVLAAWLGNGAEHRRRHARTQKAERA